MTIFHIVQNTIGNQMCLMDSEFKNITPDTVLIDIGCDSLDAVEVMMAIEDHLNIEIPQDFAFDTVGELVVEVQRIFLERHCVSNDPVSIEEAEQFVIASSIPLAYSLSELDEELLGILQEECAEVVQIVSKIRRFGLNSVNPYKNDSKTNRELLADELGDVQLAVNKLKGRMIILQAELDEREKNKLPHFMKNLRNND